MPGTIEDARAAILASSEASRVYIGCDSIRFSKKVGGKKVWFAKYSTIVVLHKDGRHGCALFHRIDEMPDFGNVKQRMLNEVMYAVEIAVDLVPVIGNRHFELHIDVNQSDRYKSNAAISEARGWVLGTLGIEPKFKPDAQAATHGADHLVRR